MLESTKSRLRCQTLTFLTFLTRFIQRERKHLSKRKEKKIGKNKKNAKHQKVFDKNVMQRLSEFQKEVTKC